MPKAYQVVTEQGLVIPSALCASAQTPYAQEQPHTCAVAGLWMVAEYYGIVRTEAELPPPCAAPRGTAQPQQALPVLPDSWDCPRPAFAGH
ncbi:MAG: hypothetical protein NZT92_15215 [Abditibacteriales bacterium]|nr:hypothetical protein [Abditibacteriales bacterium]MDW8367329.1 hypothetical protein [Abditibacteriales bacterium]